jgi:hypothetical protein
MKTSLHGILADRRELTVSEFFTSSLYGFEISDTASIGLPGVISGSLPPYGLAEDTGSIGLPSIASGSLVDLIINTNIEDTGSIGLPSIISGTLI